MSLTARQRAILQEMRIATPWLPPLRPDGRAQRATPQTPTVADTVPAAGQGQAPRRRMAPASEASPVRATPAWVDAPAATPAQAPQRARPEQRPEQRPAVVLTPPPAALPATPAMVDTVDTSAAWQLAAPVQLFPDAPLSGAASPGDAGDACGATGPGPWLLLMETGHAVEPFSSDAGQLLRNILRALRLHQRGDVWLCAVQRAHSLALSLQAARQAGTARGAAAVSWQPLAAALPEATARVRPARLMLLGQAVAHAVLGSTQPLGQLRARTHSVLGLPATVSHDPAYLLRAAHAKPAAWLDWCRACATGPAASPEADSVTGSTTDGVAGTTAGTVPGRA